MLLPVGARRANRCGGSVCAHRRIQSKHAELLTASNNMYEYYQTAKSWYSLIQHYLHFVTKIPGCSKAIPLC